MKKYAVIGTSCSGKTTTVYNVVGKLRKENIHIEGLTSTDRFYPFEQKKLDYMDEAQTYVIMQQSFLESRLSVRDDISVFLCDRSVVDFFGYYDYCITNKNNPYYKSIEQFVFNWANTYDALFYLEPLPWIDDNKRPNDTFRMNVDNVIKSYLDKLPNLVKVKGNREQFISNYIKSNL